MSHDVHQMAEYDFYRARTRALVNRVLGIFKPALMELLPFDKARQLVRPAGESYRGLQTVPVEKIVGSEGRYRDFTRFFFPKHEHLKSRWIGIDKTRYQDITLPPVALYEMGGVYFVRDGNHRVSVARAMGQEYIDAEVVSLRSEIDLHPEMTVDELRKAVIAYEKRRFYEETHYPSIIGTDDLDFSEPGRFDTIREHVLVHKYFLNQHVQGELPFHEALYSWHENVYQPIASAIEHENLLSLFHGRTVSDLYLYLVSHWAEMKRKFGPEVAIDEAALHFKRSARETRRAWMDAMSSMLAKARAFFRKFFSRL
ncbi:MAG: transcriptional regulator [Spirochaetales bacterium]|nr:transcriptional regulator [Spirochaetales bacterium]